MRSFNVATLALTVCLGLVHTTAVAAQENELGLGVYEKAQYPGARKHEWVVLPSLKWHTAKLGLTLRGDSLQLDVLPSPNVNAGLMVRYDEGRSDDIDDEVVRQLTTVPAAAELGLYVESGFPVRWLGWDDPALVIGSINLRDAVGAGHKGQALEASGGLFRDLGASTTLLVQLILTRTDTDYNRAYFGVSATEAADTGLPSFDPGAGLKDTQIRLVLTHDVDDDWTVGFTTSYGRLSDRLADSPIVSLRGDRELWTSGLYFNYRL